MSDPMDAMLTIELEQMRARQKATNMARYLRDASTADLARLTGAIAAECHERGIVGAQVALSQAQGVIEAAEEAR